MTSLNMNYQVTDLETESRTPDSYCKITDLGRLIRVFQKANATGKSDSSEMTPASVWNTLMISGASSQGCEKIYVCQGSPMFVDTGPGWPIIADQNYRWGKKDRRKLKHTSL